MKVEVFNFFGKENEMERSVYLKFAKSLGVHYNPKISMDRAKEKIKKFLKEKGVPSKLSEQEVAIVKELGFQINKSKSKSKSKSKPKPKSKPMPMPKKGSLWMIAATQAVMSQSPISIDKAIKHAQSIYIREVGKPTPHVSKYAKLYIKRTIQVLQVAKVIKKEGDQIIQL